MKLSDKIRINELLLRSLEGEISEAEFAELNGLLAADPENQAYYREAVDTYLELYECQEIITASAETVDPVLEEELWKSLAENERTAPAHPVEAVEEPRHLRIEKVAVIPSTQQINRFSLFCAITAVAALIFLLVYINMVPIEYQTEPVATVVDSVRTEWGGAGEALKNGSRLSASQGAIRLTRGFLKLRFDNEAGVVIEGPAEFRVVNADQMHLNFGRMYAVIPSEAIGFTVTTEQSRIIDLGTEFGVEVSPDQTTELHVIQGETRLVSGRKKGTHSLPVTGGQAKSVSGAASTISEVACETDRFVRNIDSADNLVWRGQKQINLADVVGGGSGFGSGQVNQGIDPDSGVYRKPEYTTRRQSNVYRSVASNQLIDGVFVPNGFSDQVVTSTGLLFEGCPVTSGYFFADLVNTPRSVRSMNNPAGLPVQLGHENYSIRETPFIFLHANLGVTFDLDAFRARLPGATIGAFVSQIGISDSTRRDSTAAFWVLVDGKVQYHGEVQTQGLADTVRVALEDDDRFLTLAVTDGGSSGPDLNESAIGYDWGVFGSPHLVLE